MKINSSFLKIFSRLNLSSQPRIFTSLSSSSSFSSDFFEFEFGKKIEFFRVQVCVRSPC